MTSEQLTNEQWARLEDAVTAVWQSVFDLCEEVVQEDFPHDDPVYHFSGATLAAVCNLRRVVDAARQHRPLPKVVRTASMCTFVLPHAGGGPYPQKQKHRIYRENPIF